MTGRQHENRFTRRQFLARSGAIGCSLAASPLLTPVVLAAAPWETRLVVIILRGGMDGLDAVQPRAAPDYARLRPTLAGPAADSHDLDGYFAAHRALGPLMELWQREELGFAHAVATPYRDKRSHFDGQDLLEAGTATLEDRRDGWLNRALQLLPGTESRTAWAIGHGEMKVLDGPAPVSDWAPDAGVTLSPQAELLAGLVMAEDPLFRTALSEALALSRADAATGPGTGEDGGAEDRTMSGARGGRKAHLDIARFVGRTLRDEGRIAAFSLNGWDSHRRQPAVIGAALGRLADTVLTLRDTMGPAAWARTAILAMSEFGRTVAENGTGGTDHGTGGVLVLAGGAIRGGQVLGRWPGLAEADLYDRRDLMPTSDLRAHAAWILRAATGLDRAALEGTVFPGLDMGADPGLLR